MVKKIVFFFALVLLICPFTSVKADYDCFCWYTTDTTVSTDHNCAQNPGGSSATQTLCERYPQSTSPTLFCTATTSNDSTRVCDTTCSNHVPSGAKLKSCTFTGASAVGTSVSPTTTAESKTEFVYPQLNVNIPTITFSKIAEDNGTIEVNFLAEYIVGLYKYLLAIGTIFAIIWIMIAGIQYVASPGGGGAGDAKKKIMGAITGLVLLMSVYLILFVVSPDLVSFDSLKLQKISYEFVSTENTEVDIKTLGLPAPSGTGTNNVPYYSQRNYPDEIYGNACSGSPTIKTSGCGPTSMAMVMTFYGVNYDPRQVAAVFESEKYRICGSGTAYQAFTSSQLLNLGKLKSEMIPISKTDEILGHLRNSEPIIISVGPKKGADGQTLYASTFTTGGHFMVLTGVNTDDSIALNDPNSGKQSITQEELWNTIKFAVYVHKQ
ncbi:MAG: Mucin related 82C [Candidatus Uhrbacteria bacterium GW2011_GWE2_45_35]|uniref:Mucin related 82C n=1 Tax=Candidatus Uhrbacteria bacterium GW2011_GWE2_45_35 TaxID=1618993 RepID=A0A0G1MGV5_9BACT|nr:MAG: Mucin related 82C [Candidatus Uhrbacteria bacterium GW2011_GWE2_45_35]